mgnify:CR=1 FL=1
MTLHVIADIFRGRIFQDTVATKRLVLKSLSAVHHWYVIADFRKFLYALYKKEVYSMESLVSECTVCS